jgi:toxin FitB
MNIVDSSGWLAFFADEPNAKHFLLPLKDSSILVVPTVSIYEVFKVILRESGEDRALQSIAATQAGRVADLTAGLALEASKLSLIHSLPMADSIILATARAFEATIWTQDADLEKIPGERYFPKR